ncbi:ATP-binding cassette domain-containing protein [Sulfurospirillum sp. 1612]|uniref:ATP-binding cassette domain-containing protein n=1 Tax=Sulfurospirillum sp. 1612 TaxID=3094835 RepID=UPI002F950CC7
MFQCEHLSISYHDKPLLDLSFQFEKSFALIGQSGSGKSLTLKAILGMLPESLNVQMRVHADYDLIRGQTIAMIPQNPFTALSPLTRIKKQFFIGRAQMLEYIRRVGLDDGIVERFPSELSGGQLQRVIIAMALSMQPKLLLLDEPTTALDLSTKSAILKLLKVLQERDGYDMLFVTHDIASVAHLCDEIGIIKAGRIIESATMEQVLHNPQEEYTKELIGSSFEKRGFRQ